MSDCIHSWHYKLETPDSDFTYECLKCGVLKHNVQKSLSELDVFEAKVMDREWHNKTGGFIKKNTQVMVADDVEAFIAERDETIAEMKGLLNKWSEWHDDYYEADKYEVGCYLSADTRQLLKKVK